MTIGAISPLSQGDTDLRPLVFAAARMRARTGVTAIPAVAAVRSVEASPDAQNYAEALTTATTYAADGRRSAWLDDASRSAFPRSQPAAAGLAALLTDDGAATHAGEAPARARNVTPADAAMGTSREMASALRGIVASPASGIYAAAARTYREVASLFA